MGVEFEYNGPLQFEYDFWGFFSNFVIFLVLKKIFMWEEREGNFTPDQKKYFFRKIHTILHMCTKNQHVIISNTLILTV